MKKISLLMPVFLFFMMLSFFSATPSHADLYWESIQETTGMPGKPNESQEIKNYLTSYASRSDHKNRIVIMNFEAKTMIQMDPSNKTYHQTNLTEMGGPPMITGEKGEAQRQMMKQKMGNIKVTPTDETRKIGDYTCKKYLVSGMMMNSEYWLSKDVTGYDEMKKTAEKLKDVFDQNPMMKQMNIAGLISQLDGFPVQMIMNIMNGKSITTLKKIEQKTLDKSLFSVPDDYTRVEGPMMPMMKKPFNKGPAATP